MDTRVPVTLLTGFLGAGKTTLLNALLTDASSGRIAVIVNEFGEVGLDHDLMETSNDDVTLMQSGCLCCTVRGELADTIASLLERRERGDFDFDRVVIETRGLADPGSILQTLLVEGFLVQRTRMDGVITVVDAANGSKTLDAQFEAVSQVAMADLLVLSKADLIGPEQVVLLEKRLRGLNPTVRITHAVRGVGLNGKLWGLGGLRTGVGYSDVLSWTTGRKAPAVPAPDPFANLSGFATPTSTLATLSRHDSRIETVSVILDEPLSETAFDDWLNTLVAWRGNNLLRVKGVVFLEGINVPFVFHGVQNIFDPPIPVKDWPGNDHQSRIVIIARDILGAELEQSFDMLRRTNIS
jgi:G3E family GTPase